MSDNGTFELGIVMAGAVSGGAYTAGVMDFLIEALDAWEKAKHDGEDVPSHGVRIKVMTGTSAGAMNTALAAVMFNEDFEHVREVPAPPGVAATNPFSVAAIPASSALQTRAPRASIVAREAIVSLACVSTAPGRGMLARPATTPVTPVRSARHDLCRPVMSAAN